MCLLLAPVFFAFYKINALNYQKYRQIQSVLVKHPEKLPNSHTAEVSSFGFKNIVADMYWLQTIQYIGGNVIGGEYKKYLFVMMDLITDLNPYFESPYVIGQLLLPSSNEAYEIFDGEALVWIEQWEKLGLKWVQNFCDTQKIEAILAEPNLQEVISNPRYENPCKSFKVPYYLAYIYYFYLKDNATSSDYYKIVSAQKDAPSWARTLAAIMQWKSGQREKSLYMFLSLAESTSSESDACVLMSEELQKTYTFIASSWVPITGKLIQDIQNIAGEILPQFSSENELTEYDGTQCSTYLAKAIRELNLMYLEQADNLYKKDHPDELSAHTPEKLFELWYIDFIPTDYQQYYEEGQGIKYKYNEEIGGFDYKMSY